MEGDADKESIFATVDEQVHDETLVTDFEEDKKTEEQKGDPTPPGAVGGQPEGTKKPTEKLGATHSHSVVSIPRALPARQAHRHNHHSRRPITQVR